MQHVIPTSVSVAQFGGTSKENCKRFVDRIEVLVAGERTLTKPTPRLLERDYPYLLISVLEKPRDYQTIN
jgi:hypothetical protein